MTKYILFILIGLLFISNIYAWEIEDFKVDIEVHTDSSLTVTETIVANFSDQPKHGIYRNIPIRYFDEKGNILPFRLKVLNIYDEKGAPWEYKSLYSPDYLQLKIGSPYKTYRTTKTFSIKYKVEGAILFLENHDELYWNAIGTEWDAPINKVTVIVRLPKIIDKNLLMAKSYSGKYGSEYSKLEAEIIDGQNIVFRGGRYIPYEGLTIVVGWPKGVVEKKNYNHQQRMDYPQNNIYQDSSYSSQERFSKYPPSFYNYPRKKHLTYSFWFLTPLLIPLFVFIIMFNLWRKHGKDPALEKSIVVEYKAPEGITPLEMGVLIDDRLDIKDISATIIDLAIRGYLRIILKKKLWFVKNYAFEKLKEYQNDVSLNEFEKIILSALFEQSSYNSTRAYSYLKWKDLLGDGFNPPMRTFVELSSLENSFYKKLNLVKESVFNQLIAKGFYVANPEKVVRFYRILGALVSFMGLFLMVAPLVGFSLLFSGLIIFAFSNYMPAKTKQGMQVYSKILGFAEFLMRTEEDKIKVSERQNVFEKMLPYAICLGISSRWTKIFSDIYSSAPSWFLTHYPTRFQMDYFIADLNNSIVNMNSTFASMPRTVCSRGGFGGGSVGGGFGGGGGGSW